MSKLNFISDQLLLWYKLYKRDLPWRNTTDAYTIWVSEIILQQTRVIQGIDYYYRFIDRFPSVDVLANASEDEVLSSWQGLGYYSRARNLHKAAKIIVADFGGVFPLHYNDMLGLPGIGKYTSAAISSFAYKQAYAVVDGNVYRVLARIFGVETAIDAGAGQKEFALLAQQLLPYEHSDVHNQAIMEFGALQCVPVSPDCKSCPLSAKCVAYKDDTVGELPVKSKKNLQRNRYFSYLYFVYGDYTYVNKRTKKDVWQHLYEFPLIEENTLLEVSELFAHKRFLELMEGVENVELITVSLPIKHILSHQVIHAQFFTLKISNESLGLKTHLKSKIADIDAFPVSRLMEKFFEKNLR